MKARCLNANLPNYHRYGGRGISVCGRWLVSFENFIADMGEKPDGMSIDRIDNDGHYEPGNCRWATPKQQDRNKSTNAVLTHNGESRCVTEWAEVLNVSARALKHRMDRGWPVERILDVSGLHKGGGHGRSGRISKASGGTFVLQADSYIERAVCDKCGHSFDKIRLKKSAGKRVEAQCPACRKWFQSVAADFPKEPDK